MFFASTAHNPGDYRTDGLCRLAGPWSSQWRTSTPDIIAMCDEIAEWSFHPKSVSDYPSLVRDFESALESLGAEARMIIGPQESQLREALKRKDTASEDVAGYARALAGRIATGDVCAAQFSALDRLNASGRANLRVLLDGGSTLVSLAAALGHDLSWSGIGPILQGVINDEPNYVRFALRAAARDNLSTGPLTIDDRVTLARDLLSEHGSNADNVVWIAVEDAAMGLPYSAFAQVQFHRGVNIRGAIDHNDYSADIPDEVRHHGSTFSKRLTGSSDEMRHVLIRVDLPNTPVVTAISEAVDIAESIFTHLGGSNHPGWRRTAAVQFIDGEPARTSYVPKRERDSYQTSAWRENPISAAIHHMSNSAFGGRIRVTPGYKRTLSYMRAFNATEGQSAENRIVIAVRAIENVRTLSGAQHDWRTFTQQNAEERWVWTGLIQDIHDALVDFSGPQTVAPWTLKGANLDAEVIARTANRMLYGGTHFSLSEQVSMALSVLLSVDRKWLPARQLNHSLQIASDAPGKRRSAVNRKRQAFRVELDRMKRYRNLGTHGGVLHDTGIERTQAFASRVVTPLIHSHLRSEEEALSLRSTLEMDESGAARLIRRATAGETLGE